MKKLQIKNIKKNLEKNNYLLENTILMKLMEIRNFLMIMEYFRRRKKVKTLNSKIKKFLIKVLIQDKVIYLKVIQINQ